MGIWTPEVRVESNRVLELNRSNPAVWTYTLPGNRQFPTGTVAALTLKNTFGQVVGTWVGTVAGGSVAFDQSGQQALVDAIPRGTSWTLIASYGGTSPRMLAQGTVVRNEAPFPDAPPQSSLFNGVQYQYSFGTPGFVFDPSWRILNGSPTVYDNSGASLPNAVAAGTLLTGLVPWDDVAMLWFAPLNTDSVRLTYNTIRNGAGACWVVLCSNYDMTNYAALYHQGVFLSGAWQHDTVQIHTGSGPVTTVGRGSPVNYTTVSNQNYTAEFNPITNTYNLYVGTSLSPVVSWTDTTNVVDHGEGERYVGFAFKSDVLTPGIEVSDWIISDAP